ncbi:MAG: glycoside hydrolase family 32 protein [Lachnospiraceae bacterium]
MRREVLIGKSCLLIPISIGKEERKLSFFLMDTMEKIAEFMVPIDIEQGEEDIKFDYFAPFVVEEYIGKTIVIEAEEASAMFLESIIEGEKREAKEHQSKLHFHAKEGWINDPNGLVYHNGLYHLYFQYNPFNVSWNNMSWGHAISKDLLTWTQVEDVMYPDQEGMMFSGCGLVNEKGLLGLPKDALLFFYSAAGDATDWSKGKEFTQRIAYSLDGGATFIKTNRGMLPTIKKENRDPKIFYHESSQAYIMSLWLEKNDFAILRSTDLETWEQTQVITLDEAWECPDLLKFIVDEKDEKWIFWSADGFYFVGEFDGYQFRTDGIRKHAYINKIPYAAQTYSGIKDQVISVSWLRTKNENQIYTGCMAIPQVLGLIKTKEGYVLTQKRIEIIEEKKVLLLQKKYCLEYKNETKEPIEISVKRSLESEKVELNIGGNNVSYNANTGEFRVNEEYYQLEKHILDFSFIIHETLFEVSGNNDIIYGAFEVAHNSHIYNVNGEESDEFYLYEINIES